MTSFISSYSFFPRSSSLFFGLRFSFQIVKVKMDQRVRIMFALSVLRAGVAPVSGCTQNTQPGRAC